MIGSLLYLIASRPYIMFATCLCARFQADPRDIHLIAVKRILRYLKGTPNLGIWYPRESGFNLLGYTDSDYAGSFVDRKSTSRSCQFLGSRLILVQQETTDGFQFYCRSGIYYCWKLLCSDPLDKEPATRLWLYVV